MTPSLMLIGDGTLYDVAPYLLYVKPVFLSIGNVIYTGSTQFQLTEAHRLQVLIRTPNVTAIPQPHRLFAGNYVAIGLDLLGVNHNVLGSKNGRLRNNLLTKTPEQLDNDTLIGEHLTRLILHYFLLDDKLDHAAAKLYHMGQMRMPSEGTAAITQTVRYFFGIPRSTSPNRLEVDVALDAVNAVHKGGQTPQRTAYLKLRHLSGSYNEHDVFEAVLEFDSISAVRGIQLAHAQGIPVHHITPANAPNLLPLLQLDPDDIAEIQNGLQAGLEAIVPERELTFNDWRGVGFIIRDPEDASGLYRISGGLAGGGTTKGGDGFQIVELFTGPFAALRDKLDLFTRGAILSIVIPEAAAAEFSCDDMYQEATVVGAKIADVGERIAQEARRYMEESWPYDTVRKCTGLVVRAYHGAGIYLASLAKDNKIGHPRYVPNLYKLAEKIGLNGGVRSGNPLSGDIVFFKYTYERNWEPNYNCKLADEKQPTHAGVVERIASDGTVYFIHASRSLGATRARLNRSRPEDGSVNSALRIYPPAQHEDGSYCPEDAVSPDNPSGFSVRAGSLFGGYATIRNSQ